MATLEEMRAMAGREIQPGETLRWVGAPDGRRAWRPALPIVLFGVPWTLFALFWEGMAIWGTSTHRTSAPSGFDVVFPLFGLPFVAVGLGMLSSPWWMIRRARQTVYAITDRRVLMIVAGRTLTVNSYSGADFANVERRELPDGSGDLVFLNAAPPVTSSTRSYQRQGGTTPPGLYGIPAVRNVERLLREIVVPSRNAAPPA